MSDFIAFLLYADSEIAGLLTKVMLAGIPAAVEEAQNQKLKESATASPSVSLPSIDVAGQFLLAVTRSISLYCFIVSVTAAALRIETEKLTFRLSFYTIFEDFYSDIDVLKG